MGIALIETDIALSCTQYHAMSFCFYHRRTCLDTQRSVDARRNSSHRMRLKHNGRNGKHCADWMVCLIAQITKCPKAHSVLSLHKSGRQEVGGGLRWCQNKNAVLALKTMFVPGCSVSPTGIISKVVSMWIHQTKGNVSGKFVGICAC